MYVCMYVCMYVSIYVWKGGQSAGRGAASANERMEGGWGLLLLCNLLAPGGASHFSKQRDYFWLTDPVNGPAGFREEGCVCL